jgi:hypothetical protein
MRGRRGSDAREPVTALRIRVGIDGRAWSDAALDDVRHRRHLHVLHTMRALGATISRDGQALTSPEIAALAPDPAREISIATRAAYGVDALTELFRDDIAASDRLWKRAGNPGVFADKPLRCAVTHVRVRGLTADALGAHTADPETAGRDYPLLNPDHYFLESEDGRTHAMETFGLRGGPTDMHVVVDPTVQPVLPEPGYARLTSGYATLASDGTDIGLYAFHQIRPVEGGFDVKLGAYFPPGTPQPIVDGHKVHMAIEFRELCRLHVR